MHNNALLAIQSIFCLCWLPFVLPSVTAKVFKSGFFSVHLILFANLALNLPNISTLCLQSTLVSNH